MGSKCKKPAPVSNVNITDLGIHIRVAGKGNIYLYRSFLRLLRKPVYPRVSDADNNNDDTNDTDTDTSNTTTKLIKPIDITLIK